MKSFTVVRMMVATARSAVLINEVDDAAGWGWLERVWRRPARLDPASENGDEDGTDAKVEDGMCMDEPGASTTASALSQAAASQPDPYCKVGLGGISFSGEVAEVQATISAGCAVCRCAELEFGGVEWCLKAIERELAHDVHLRRGPGGGVVVGCTPPALCPAVSSRGAEVLCHMHQHSGVLGGGAGCVRARRASSDAGGFCELCPRWMPRRRQ